MIYKNLAIIISVFLATLYTLQEQNFSNFKLTQQEDAPLTRWDNCILPQESSNLLLINVKSKLIKNEAELQFIMDRSFDICKNLNMEVNGVNFLADYANFSSATLLPLFKGLSRWESLNNVLITLNSISLNDNHIQGLHHLEKLNLFTFSLLLMNNNISNLTTFLTLSKVSVKSLNINLKQNDITSIDELALFEFEAGTLQFSLDVSYNPVKAGTKQIQIPKNPMNLIQFHLTMQNVKNARGNGVNFADCLKNFQFYTIQDLIIDFSNNDSLFETKLKVKKGENWFKANLRLSGLQYLGKVQTLDKFNLNIEKTNVTPSAMHMIDKELHMLLPTAEININI